MKSRIGNKHLPKWTAGFTHRRALSQGGFPRCFRQLPADAQDLAGHDEFPRLKQNMPSVSDTGRSVEGL